MEKSLRMAASAKRRNVCGTAFLILLMMAVFALGAAARKKSAEEQKTADPQAGSQAGQQSTQTEQRRDKDDPRARETPDLRIRQHFEHCVGARHREWLEHQLRRSDRLQIPAR